MDRRYFGLFLIFLLLGILILSALPSTMGNHESNHRYTVDVRVTDINGHPAQCIEVKVEDVTVGVSNVGTTNRSGFYSVGLHLHNNNLDDTIRVSAGNVSNETKASFTPNDSRTQRVGTVDLRLKEKSDSICPDFTVEGKVTDVNGDPAQCMEVKVEDVTVGVSYVGMTNRSGFYSVRIHLHDIYLDDTIRVSSGGVSNETNASFNPQDQITPRVGTINLQLKEKSESTCPDEHGDNFLPSHVVVM